MVRNGAYGCVSLSVSGDFLSCSSGLRLPLSDILSARLVHNDSLGAGLVSLVVDVFCLKEGKRVHSQQVFVVEEKQGNILIEAINKQPTPPHCPPRRSLCRVLVLTNPFSGQKRAQSLWESEAEPLLSLANIHAEIRLTQHAGHAVEIARELDLDEYDMVVVNSGDGLVSEVLTGFLQRRDVKRALRMPLAHLPGGTSNALAAAICFACNEPFSARDLFMREVAGMIARPRFLPLQLYRVETSSRGVLPMFLSTTWGLIADIDIESERFRWAGMIRLHIDAVIRIAQLPSTCNFHGRIWYLPVRDASLSRKTRLRFDADRSGFGLDHFNYEAVQPMDGSHTKDDQGEPFSSIGEALEAAAGPRQLPPLGQPITDERFVCVEGSFVMVNLTSLSHLGSDLPYLPTARLDEDIFYLSIVDWKTVKNRLEVASLMITVDSSKHLDYPCFQVIPVRACRVEPSPGVLGHVAVDGEPCGRGVSFQAEALPFQATVVGRKLREE